MTLGQMPTMVVLKFWLGCIFFGFAFTIKLEKPLDYCNLVLILIAGSLNYYPFIRALFTKGKEV